MAKTATDIAEDQHRTASLEGITNSVSQALKDCLLEHGYTYLDMNRLSFSRSRHNRTEHVCMTMYDALLLIQRLNAYVKELSSDRSSTSAEDGSPGIGGVRGGS